MTSSQILSRPLDEVLLWLSDEPLIGMNEEYRIALRARLRQESRRLEEARRAQLAAARA